MEIMVYFSYNEMVHDNFMPLQISQIYIHFKVLGSMANDEQVTYWVSGRG